VRVNPFGVVPFLPDRAYQSSFYVNGVTNAMNDYLQIPLQEEFSSEFFDLESRFLQILPKTRRFCGRRSELE